MENIEVSPVASDPTEIPDNISFTQFLIERLKIHFPNHADKPWVLDVSTGRNVKYGEIEDQSRRVASALSRIGLRHGDILYFVTYDMVELYVAILAAWRLGAAVRGCYQKEETEELARQMIEGDVKIALIDVETAPVMQEACTKLEWEVKLVSLGSEPVEGVISFESLLKDDGTAFPSKVKINPREDLLIVLNTSGSTGIPKGVMQSHYAAVACLYSMRNWTSIKETQLLLTNNFTGSNFLFVTLSLYGGGTHLSVPKLERNKFVKQLLEYKPACILMHPSLISWFARAPEVLEADLSFIKEFKISGLVLNVSTLKYIEKALPTTTINVMYGMSEVNGVSMTHYAMENDTDTVKTCEFDARLYRLVPSASQINIINIFNHVPCPAIGITHVSTGKLFPYVKVKLVASNGAKLGRMQSGEILVQAPYVMMGYLSYIKKPPNRSAIDKDGWYHTGDLGFFDLEGHLYVQERKAFMFKYYNTFVSPSAIEAVLSEHPDVQEAGVVGMPNLETPCMAQVVFDTCLPRAMVVLRPGAQVTAAELEVHVSQRLPTHMHLHGGVAFLEQMPISRGVKLDRTALLNIAVLGDLNNK